MINKLSLINNLAQILFIWFLSLNFASISSYFFSIYLFYKFILSNSIKFKTNNPRKYCFRFKFWTEKAYVVWNVGVCGDAFIPNLISFETHESF